MIVVELAVAALSGGVIGAAVTIRLTPRIIARMPKAEQVAFARRVGRLRVGTGGRTEL